MATPYDRRWRAISERTRAAQGYCTWCGCAQGELYLDHEGRERRVRLTVDHIRPLSAGGGSDRSNLRVLCDACHGGLTASARWS